MTDDRLKAALDMAREAGDLAQSMRDSPTELKTSTKGPMDLVTSADHAVETSLPRSHFNNIGSDDCRGQFCGR